VEIDLNCRAAQIGGAQHTLLLDYGFTVVKVTEDTAAYRANLTATRSLSMPLATGGLSPKAAENSEASVLPILKWC